MEPLRIGQNVTFVDAAGVTHPATVVEAYQNAALINVPDLAANLTANRFRFEDSQPPPYITDADGSTVTEASFEAPIAEE